MKLAIIIIPTTIILIAILSATSGTVAQTMPEPKIDAPSTAFLMGNYGALTETQIRILEVLSGHAWQRHPGEIDDAINCLRQHGSSKAFKTFGFKGFNGEDVPTNLWMCFDGTDWFGIVTTIFEKRGADKAARLITGYKVATDLFPRVEDYLSYIALKWNATAIAYQISAGQIEIMPIK